MTAVEAPKPRSDLTVRAVAGIAMITVALTAIYLGGWPFRILVCAASALMLREWCDMHRIAAPWPIVGIALLLANLLLPSDVALPAYGAALAVAILLGLMARSARLGGGYLYVALPSLALLTLNALSWQTVIWAMVVTWSTDIFAYFAGRGIGGPKLAPTISPNKTWAGLIGGMTGAGVLGAAAAYGLHLDPIFLLAGAPLGLIAQLGDLYESALKRKAGVKDSGNILPGHGGVLDRLDGLLPVVMATLTIVLLSGQAA